MLERYAAQGLLDGMAALALGACASGLAHAGLRAPLRVRLGFTLGGLGLFFATRSAFEALTWPWLAVTVLLIVCALPLAALILAEGVLRRHAPAALKALVVAGGLVMAVLIAATRGAEPASSAGLGAYVLASLIAVAVLLVLRDRASLSPQENVSVDALMAVAVLLALLTVTDFLPQAPIGLSGVGVVVLAFVLQAAPGSRRDGRHVAVELAIVALLAAAGAAAFAGPMAIRTPTQIFRLAMLMLTLILTAATVTGALRRRAPQTLSDFGVALAGADTSSLERFMETLVDQPLLSGLRLAEGPALADYDAGGLAAFMGARVIRSGETVDAADAAPTLRAREELADLMARNEATHAMMLSRTPLRVALLTLPTVGFAEGAETYLALFRKLAVVAAGNPQ